MASVLRDVIIAFLLFGTVTTGLVIFMVGVYENYGVTIEPQFESVYNTINNTVATNTEYSRNITDKIETSEGMTTTETFTGAIFQAIKLPFQVVQTATSVLTTLATMLGIPTWIIGVFITILMLMIAFAIISAVRGFEV